MRPSHADPSGAKDHLAYSHSNEVVDRNGQAFPVGLDADLLANGRGFRVFRAATHRGVRERMPDASVDAVITDPPYSSGGFTRGDRSLPPAMKYTMNGTTIERPALAGDNPDQPSFAYWCALWLGECLRVAMPGAPLCVFRDWRRARRQPRPDQPERSSASC